MTIKRVEKPWGYELIWAHTDKYVGKILHINAGHQLSLQYHRIKEETVYLQSGRMDMIISSEKREMHPGDVIHIPTATIHRMIAVTDCDVFEVSTPELDDVVRLEDSYGR